MIFGNLVCNDGVGLRIFKSKLYYIITFFLILLKWKIINYWILIFFEFFSRKKEDSIND